VETVMRRAQNRERGEDRVEVRHGLTHSHIDHVGDPASEHVTRHELGIPELRDDLRRAELPPEPEIAGGAEAARQGAAGLGRQAQGDALSRRNQYGFDLLPISQAPQMFDGSVPRTGLEGHLQGGNREPRIENRAQIRREIGHLVEPGGEPLVHPAGDLSGPVGGLSQLGERRPQHRRVFIRVVVEQLVTTRSFSRS
jgi:hypothetical protein